ncbi:TetR family transcriptional regulator [Mycobacterium crocinum]|uniref:TetR/AcrR family transcriptional regulator n=2 Tax=Mycolicibacterium TaxID=1866885 RepID=A0ABX8VJF8_9MYCO|nr:MULTISPECIES: TetR family transcriptional regulator [Mycolicibacterium]APE16609.1 TetR family transcriptional regulator [Mycobacterium sp. WY10]MCV7213863.1 TetR family transcriptional regulator [Mycolicibacterium crocinum]QYL17936.1 TetR/AcrR family transcriptional regulator [Mycolicibacterium pallens]ULN42631.1 TetR/AcrR family transcriptional regulator [Mycolicibacterium crocinum]
MTSPPAQRPPTLRDRQRAQVRADIHAAAYRLFAARGFGNVTTDDIAAEASVSPRTFFRHVAAKEDLLLGAVQRGNAAIASLLMRRPPDEAPDAALAAAIVSRVESFDDVDLENWRAAILTAPELLDRATLLSTADRDQMVELVAARMNADPTDDARPGLLVQLSFAAADFAFQRWVKNHGVRSRPLASDVAEALAVVAHPRWSG